ncbi:MAG: Trm112 family protein [Desulfovermiculus sp.]
MALNKELLDILVCPECKGDLELTSKEDGLICRACELVYPIRDDIPIMLLEESVQLKNWTDTTSQ